MNNNIKYPVQNQALVPFIKHYFVLDFDYLEEENNTFKIPPSGYPVLLFHFGKKHNFYNHLHYTSESLIVGELSRHVMLHPSRETKILGVNFKPYGLYNLLGISPRHILNSGFKSCELFGTDNVDNISSTIKKDGIETGITEIEKLLLKYKNNSTKPQPYFDKIVDDIEELRGLVNVSDLINNKVSIRTFQRYFKEIIGVSPKLFCQILRHKYILEFIYQNPELQWNDLLLNGYYYDFSHFTKDFTKFSGLKPSEYLQIKNDFASFLLDETTE